MATIRFGSAATGHLIWTVPKLITRTSFAPTPPEPPVSAKATIVSFETPVTLGQVSRAVAKLTQGDPKKAWYQWQYLDKSWINANTHRNPATDDDHHYALPRVGRFPIRLQTWDAVTGGTMTDQTGSPRVIEVQAVPVPPDPPDPGPGPGPDPEPPLPGPVSPFVGTDQRIFRTTGNFPQRWKGFSAFPLCHLYSAGTDILPFLQAYAGYNLARVWDYVTWTGTGWESNTADQWRAFCRYMASQGFNVELTLLTDDNPARIDPARRLVQGLSQGVKPVNLVIEIGNEPETHKHINTPALRADCDASGFLYASGNYEQNAKAFGKYGVAHTARDAEWPRKAHDLMEYYNGGGPHNSSDPARRYPWVGDEPAKTQDVAAPKPPLTKADDWRAYFGTASLLGAGATFHSETGKFGQLPTDEERPLLAAALEGLNAFPADAPFGAYTRPDDNSLRTYCVGNYMVRVRPTTPEPKFGGWTRIGASNVLWRK